MLKRLNSTYFNSSNILTNEQSVSVLKLINFPLNNTFTLIYQATRDGFEPAAFHSKCDYKQNTLIIFKTSLSFIFGGFTTADWSGNASYKYDSNAFLFSLINQVNVPVKLNLIHPQYAILADSTKGPSFGAGQDINTPNTTNQWDSTGFSNLGFSYQTPMNITYSTNEARLFLASTSFIRNVEIEAYVVKEFNPCWNFPCQNGGLCTQAASSFKCDCINGYFGLNCLLKGYNSSIFKSSNILTNDLSNNLLKLIKFPLNKTWTLLYQATRDGFEPTDFHTRCDYYTNTLTVIKSNSSYVFGGFTTKGNTNFSRLPTDPSHLYENLWGQ